MDMFQQAHCLFKPFFWDIREYMYIFLSGQFLSVTYTQYGHKTKGIRYGNKRFSDIFFCCLKNCEGLPKMFKSEFNRFYLLCPFMNADASFGREMIKASLITGSFFKRKIITVRRMQRKNLNQISFTPSFLIKLGISNLT